MTAFAGMSFGLFTDSGCTVPFSYNFLLLDKTDLSDNPQDKLLYLGSLTIANMLQATSNPGVDDITLTPTDIVPEWQANTSYAVNDRVQAVGGDGFIYKCTASTGDTLSGASAPTWPAGGLGSTVVDDVLTWTKISAKHEVTEIILGLSSGDLGTNVPGDPLALGNTILGGSGNAVPVYIRFVNAVTNIDNSTAYPELDIFINEVIETAI